MLIFQQPTQCSNCEAMNATISRRTGSREVHVDCPTCGRSLVLEEQNLTNDISHGLQDHAAKRIESILGGDKRFGEICLSSLVLALIALGLFQDGKMAFLILAFAALMWAAGRGEVSRIQLGYVIRLLRHQLPASTEIAKVMSGKLTDYDILASHRMSRNLVGKELDENPEYRYNALVLWLGDSLQEMGCSERTVEKEKEKMRNLVLRAGDANRIRTARER